MRDHRRRRAAELAGDVAVTAKFAGAPWLSITEHSRQQSDREFPDADSSLQDQVPRRLRRHNVLPPVPPVATHPLPGGGTGACQPARTGRSEVHVSSNPSATTTRTARIGTGS